MTDQPATTDAPTRGAIENLARQLAFTFTSDQLRDLHQECVNQYDPDSEGASDRALGWLLDALHLADHPRFAAGDQTDAATTGVTGATLATDLLERIETTERERDAAHGRAEHLDGEAARLRWVVEQQAEQLQRHGDLICRLRDLGEQADRAWADHDTEHADVQPEWHITPDAAGDPAGDPGSPPHAQGDRQAAAVEALSRALKACGCWLRPGDRS